MKLNNDDTGQNLIRNTVLNHYKCAGIVVSLFLISDEHQWHYEHFLLDRKHVFRYGIGKDREITLATLELGIGPHYFGPSDFLDYQNSQRFSIEASTNAVEQNLNLLDEFLGYQSAKNQ